MALTGLPAIADDTGPRGGRAGRRAGRARGALRRARPRPTPTTSRSCSPSWPACRRAGARRASARSAWRCFPDGREWRRARACSRAASCERAAGANGFGYDPVFVLPDGRTLAQLTDDEKNATPTAPAPSAPWPPGSPARDRRAALRRLRPRRCGARASCWSSPLLPAACPRRSRPGRRPPRAQLEQRAVDLRAPSRRCRASHGTTNVSMPHCSASWLRTATSEVNASSGMRQRCAASRRAEPPEAVNAASALAPVSAAMCTAAAAIACGPSRSVPRASARRDARQPLRPRRLMRAIVSTASIGHSPTLVSPESISASAPSSTAFATSEASARVGREWVIIDSSICVATITGRACSRAPAAPRASARAAPARAGSPRPRSPRATIRPSNACDDGLECRHGLGLLDLGDHRQPRAELVHDRVRLADVVGRAHERERDQVHAQPHREAQVVAVLLAQLGALTRTPGRLMPLVVRDRARPRPRCSARACRRWPRRAASTLPSSMSTVSPGVHVGGQRGVGGRDACVASPATRSVVSVNVRAGLERRRSPRRTRRGGSWGPAGPRGCRPRGRSRRRRGARARRATAWSSREPCEKFSRATSMPARTSARMRSELRVAGPSVQTIFARRVMGGYRLSVWRARALRESRRSAIAARRAARGRGDPGEGWGG